MTTVSKLQIVLEATTTAFDRGLRSATNTLNGFARQVGQMHDRMDGFVRRNQQAFDSMQRYGAVAGVSLVAVSAGLKVAVDEAIKFESAMADVKKVIDFDTPQAFKEMNDDIIKLSQSLPMSADGIAKIVANAGQTGIAKNELLKFAETAAKMATAFDITADEAGQALAEMRVAFKMNQAEVETLADKINYLGNTTPNTAKKIMEVVQRIGSLGGIAGVSADQITALAGSVTAVEPEVVATSLKNMMLAMTKGASATKSQREAMEGLGLSVEKVAKGMQVDSMGTFLDVIERIKKLPKELQVSTINDIFGSEALPVIAQFVDNTEILKTNLRAMGDSSKYAGSMLKEFEGMAGTTKAQMQIFSNNITAVKIALGNALLPTINSVMQSLAPFLQKMSEWANANPELVSKIALATTAILGLGVAIGAIGLIIPAIVSGMGVLVSVFGAIGSFVGMVSSAVSTIGVFGAVVAGLSFPVTTIVAGITALVAGGVLLWQNWDTVKAKADEVWFAIGEIVAMAVENVKSYFVGIGDWFGRVWEGIKTVISTKINEIKQAFFEWLSGMPVPVQEMVANIISIFEGMAMMWDIVKVSAQIAWQWIKDTANTTAQEVTTAWQTFISHLSVMWDNIKTYAKSAWDGVVAITKPIIDTLVNIIRAGLMVIVSVWQLQFTNIKLAVGVIFEGIKSVVSGGINAIKAILTAGLTVFASVFNAGFNLIKNTFTTTFNAIKALVRGDMAGVANAIRAGLSNAVSIIRSMVGNIVEAFRGLGSQLLQAGRDAIQGFINGVRQKMGEALSVAHDMANSVASTVKSALNIRSPSRVMRELGVWAGEGFVLGVSDKIKDAKQVANDLANALTSTLQDLHRQNFMLINDSNPLAELEYKLQFGELAKLTDKQKERLRELAKINLDIQKANEKTAESLRQQEQSAQNIAQANERSKSNYASLQKQIALFGNQSKVAEFDYDLKNGAFNGVDDMLLLREWSAIADLEKLQMQDKTKTAFTQMQGGLAGDMSPLAKLQKELDDRLRIIQDFENAHTGVELEAQLARRQAEEAYLTAKNNLMLDNYGKVFNGISGMTKSFFGEQSGIYRAMFAMEKGFAIAKAIIALKANIAEASKIGFPQNIPMIAGAVSQGMGIVNDIRSVVMPVGQAHDGIMSVPKSGTWNLEKGERVLPKHTAQNLDNTLNRLQGNGGGQVINISVTVNADSGDVQSSHDLGKNLGNAIKTAVQAELQKERRQGGLFYGR